MQPNPPASAFLERPLLADQLPTVPQAERDRWKVVLKRQGEDLAPWVLLGPSEFLKEMGLAGEGLYALHALRGPRRGGLVAAHGDSLGNYNGTVVGGPFESPESEEAVEAGSALAQRGGEHLLFVESRGVGWRLVDGRDPGPPFLSKMNDARSSRNNVKFTATGTARATKGVPAADLSGGAEALAPSELLVAYGASYWRFREKLGSASTPFVLE